MNSLTLYTQRALPSLCLLIYVLAVSVGTFTGGLWAGLAIGGALLMFAGTAIIEHKIPELDRTISLFVLTVIVTIAALNFHSDYRSVVWHFWFQLATILVPLSLLFSPQLQKHIRHPKFFPVVTLAAGIGAAALGIELSLGSPLLHLIKGANAGITEYNRGVSYLTVLAFPIMAYLRSVNRRWALAVFILILLVPTSLTDSRATRMALIFSLVATIAAFLAPVFTRRALATLLVASISFPFAMTHVFLAYPSLIEKLPPSWHHRMEIWDYMSYRIFEHPILGWGIGSSKYLPFQIPHGEMYHYVVDAAPHPHNVIIQLWVELGLPGLGLGFACALYALFKAGKLPVALVPFALGAWVAALSISLVAYNFWTDSLFAMFALTSLAFVVLKTHQGSHI